MKHNLAKVLGLEEYNEEPNIRVEPTEDEVIQIEQDKFVQEMADHSEATTEALEAIGNAQALASVIARNDSTDKTTYELLKVAVEQLKEKTGVKTDSVSLESLDKTSYKTEALQDIKKTVVAIWEAIKKAFFAMVDKIRAFFKGIFNKGKVIEKEAQEVVDMTDEFIMKNNGKKGYDTQEVSNHFSDEVYEYLGKQKPQFSRGHTVRLSGWDESSAVRSISIAISEVAGHYADIEKGGSTSRHEPLKDKVSASGEFDSGIYSYEVIIKDGKVDLNIIKTKKIEDLKNIENVDAKEIKNSLLKEVKTYIKKVEELDGQLQKDIATIKTMIWINEKVFSEYTPEELDNNKENIKLVKETTNLALQNAQASAVAYAKLSTFMYKKARAVIKYARESIKNLSTVQETSDSLKGDIDQVAGNIK